MTHQNESRSRNPTFDATTLRHSQSTLGGDLPDLPLEPQIKDQVTVIFNKLRAKKREAELAKNLLPDIGKFI